MYRCFQNKTALVDYVLSTLFENHEKYHAMDFPKLVSVDDRKFAFTLFFCLGVRMQMVYFVDSISRCDRCILNTEFIQWRKG